MQRVRVLLETRLEPRRVGTADAIEQATTLTPKREWLQAGSYLFLCRIHPDNPGADRTIKSPIRWQFGSRSPSCRKIAISNNVGGVKRFSSKLLHALVGERHFALVVGLRCPTLARFE